jgi:stearoyl-CoA desaturase (delta-9 desaturase)
MVQSERLALLKCAVAWPEPAAPEARQGLPTEGGGPHPPDEHALPPEPVRGRMAATLIAVRRWFDTWDRVEATGAAARRIDWMRILPFLALHLSVALIVLVGWSPTAVVVAVLLYVVRMFAITAFYHRYFSHRTFKTSRAMQFVFALLGNSACNAGRCGGPLTTASTTATRTRPRIRTRRACAASGGATWAGSWRARTSPRSCIACATWRASRSCASSTASNVIVPVLGAVFVFGVGELLRIFVPQADTSGLQLPGLGDGLDHRPVPRHVHDQLPGPRGGTQPYATRDDSRNNVWLALLTLGEGWHKQPPPLPGRRAPGFPLVRGRHQLVGSARAAQAGPDLGSQGRARARARGTPEPATLAPRVNRPPDRRPAAACRPASTGPRWDRPWGSRACRR